MIHAPNRQSHKEPTRATSAILFRRHGTRIIIASILLATPVLVQVVSVPSALPNHVFPYNIFSASLVIKDSGKNQSRCALDAPGSFDFDLRRFRLQNDDHQSTPGAPKRKASTATQTQLPCPWVDYAARILRTKEKFLTTEEKHEKQRLISDKPRNVLLVGDSQERNIVEHLCKSSRDAELRVVRPRWTDIGSPTIIRSTTSDKSDNLLVCTIGNLTVANFFHFGLIGHHRLADNHVSFKDDEPTKTDRIQRMLPYFVRDAFASSLDKIQLNAIVLNSGLWDLLAIATHESWREELSTLLSNRNWGEQVYNLTETIRNILPTSEIIWRNMPDVVEERTKHRDIIQVGALTNPFTSKHVEWMNHVGTVTAKDLGLPILDWRGSLVQGELELLTDWDGFHIRKAGLDVYINRILNFIMASDVGV